ncbi:MAG: corrinoid protein [Gemmatimonadetes bacterium]|nr:corrinoid protein [Gemmatimonadota bacterium]
MNFQKLSDMIIKGDNKGAEQWTRTALDAGTAPKDIIDKGLVPGMDVVGRRFKSNEYHMPEVLIAARAMKASMNLVRPLIAGTDVQPVGRVVIGTVQGDLHDIGKNLVAMMLEGAGFEVHDLGVDVSPQAFVEAAESHRANLVGLSALLTTTMPMMRNVIEAFEQAELRAGVKILIGGAPVTQAYADQITADGYAPDGASAVDVAKSLVAPRRRPRRR